MSGFKTHPVGGDVTMRGEAFAAPDVKHPGAEDRLLAIGRDKNMRPLSSTPTGREPESGAFGP